MEIQADATLSTNEKNFFAKKKMGMKLSVLKFPFAQLRNSQLMGIAQQTNNVLKISR